MEKFWVEIIKKTGYFGVGSFLLFSLMDKVFSEAVINLFGSEKLFEITFVLASGLVLILILALVFKKEKSSKETDAPKTLNKVTYKDDSTHNGNNQF